MNYNQFTYTFRIFMVYIPPVVGSTKNGHIPSEVFSDSQMAAMAYPEGEVFELTGEYHPYFKGEENVK